MRRIIAALLLVAFAARGAEPATSPEGPSADDALGYTRAQIDLANRYIEANDAASAAVALDRVIHSDGFAQLADETSDSVLQVAAGIRSRLGDHADAHALWVRLSETTRAASEVWHERLAEAFATGDYADSANCVATIARRWPKTLDRIRDEAIFVIEDKVSADANQAAVHQDLLEALFTASWSDAENEASQLWRDLALTLLKQGEERRAIEVAARVTSAWVALSMRVDKRFDPITLADPERYDIDRIAKAEVAAARAAVDAAPDRLAPIARLQSLLLDTRQYDQAITLADAVSAKVKGRIGASVYRDFDEKYVWVLNQRADALARLGRWDEALAQLARAALRREDGKRPNVSQVLNLGTYQANLGQSERALETVSQVGHMSPYGRMQLVRVQYVAALQRQDPAAAAHFAFLREHRSDALDTWQHALLVSGDLDAAGDLLVERLRDESMRRNALVDMQTYIDVQRTPFEASVHERWLAVLAQPRVREALAAVGRIERVNLVSSSY